MNMSCYMSDDEGLALPRVSELSSPIGGTVNVLDMINQDVMFGNGCQGAKSNANTQVTYVREAPSSAFTGDLIPPLVPMTAIETSAKPTQAGVPPTPSSNGGKAVVKKYHKPAYNSSGSKFKRTSTNPFDINPFVSNQNQSLLNPFVATADDSEKDRNVAKKSTSSSKKSKGKTNSSPKKTSQSSPKSTKKVSRSAPKTKDSTAIVLTQKSRITPTCTGGGISTVTHTVTRTTTNTIMRTTNIAAESRVASSSVTVAATSANVCLVTATTAAMTANTMTVVGASGAAVTTITTSTSTCHTVTKTRAPINIISPLRSTYLPTSILYSTPTIITRTPSAASVGEKSCEQYSILPAPAATEAGGRPRTRLVIPITLNAFATTVTTTTTTTTANTDCKRRPMHAVRPSQSPMSSLAAAGRQTAHTSFTLPPGATLYAAKKLAKTSRPAVTSEPQTFAIVDSKGTYTTLTIAPDLASSSASRLNRIQVTTAATTSAVSNTSSVTTEAAARPRNQLLIPIANSQMNTNTSLGYLVTSPIAPPASTTTASPTTTIASHTITTISSEALSKIRNRLIYNVPAVGSGMTTLPSSTISAEGGRSRGPVTIIANQLVSAVGRGDSAATPAGPAPRPVSRVVIPLMSNVHAACTGHSTKSTQGTYIIAGINPAAVSKNAVTRPSRVVIPILHNTSGAVASTSTTAASAGSKSSPALGTCMRRTSADPHSKLRNRLTIQVTNSDSTATKTTSPITAYTITRSRTPQNVYTIPTGSTPYVSVTKTSEVARNPATMALITFSPPGTRGASGAANPARKSANDSPVVTDTPSTTNTTTTKASGVNRIVLKIGTSTSSGAAASTVTSSVTAPVTTAVVSPTEHQFAEPQPISSRLRTFPGPRTYSLAQRTAAATTAATTAAAPQRTLARTATPRIKKVITTPAPLQIFADVVCPPASQAQAPAATTAPALKSRFTLTQSAGTSTLIVPKYKNTVFKNLTTIAHLNSDRLNSGLAGPRVSSERFVLNRSVAFVSPRRAVAETSAAGPAPAVAGGAAPAPARPARSAHPDTRAHSARSTDGTPTTNATTKPTST